MRPRPRPVAWSVHAAATPRSGSRPLRYADSLTDPRFDSLEDGDLADIWYALGGTAVRHPEHFQPLFDAVATELLSRRSEGLNPWLEQRFRAFRLADTREDAAVSTKAPEEGS